MLKSLKENCFLRLKNLVCFCKSMVDPCFKRKPCVDIKMPFQTNCFVRRNRAQFLTWSKVKKLGVSIILSQEGNSEIRSLIFNQPGIQILAVMKTLKFQLILRLCIFSMILLKQLSIMKRHVKRDLHSLFKLNFKSCFKTFPSTPQEELETPYCTILYVIH